MQGLRVPSSNGCVGDAGSDRLVIERNVRIPTGEAGVTLSAVVVRPSGTERVPALVSVYPYRTDAWIHEYMRPYLHWFAAHGYASVLVDLLGTGSSDGLMRPFHDPTEADDGECSVRWAATQNWCTGSVGMWGLSFGGFLTMATAQRDIPELKAIMPLMNSLDPERETMHPHGARGGLQPLVQWGLQQLTYQLLPPMHDYGDPVQQRRWSEHVLQEPVLTDLAAHGPGHPIWKTRALDPSLISTPAFCIGGWRDTFQWSLPRAFEQMQGPKRLMMGPWGHVVPQGSPFEAVDFLGLALRWWDHWLRGVDNGVMDEPPVLVHVQGAAPEWRGLPTWPPSESAGLDLVSVGRGELRTPAERTPRAGDEEPSVYLPDPRIGPYSGIQCIGASSRLVLPLDQHTDDMRAVTFTSEPVDADVVICGLPRIVLRAATQSPEFSEVQRLVLRLTDVDPDGRSTMITTCVATQVGTDDPVELSFWPTAYRLAAGHRIRVAVSDSGFPWLVPLATPRPFTLSQIALNIPILDVDAASVVEIPRVSSPLSGMTFADSNWVIEEEPNRDGLGFRMWSRRDYTTPQGHKMREETTSKAHVLRHAPEDVMYEGERSISATMVSGRKILVQASVTTSQGMMVASGEVMIDGVTGFSNQWRIPLSITSDEGHGAQG